MMITLLEYVNGNSLTHPQKTKVRILLLPFVAAESLEYAMKKEIEHLNTPA